MPELILTLAARGIDLGMVGLLLSQAVRVAASISASWSFVWGIASAPRDQGLCGSLRASASQGIAATTLARREQINNDLRLKLGEVTERRGVKVTAVEIREVSYPRTSRKL